MGFCSCPIYCLLPTADGKKVMVDVENKKGPEILETLTKLIGATER